MDLFTGKQEIDEEEEAYLEAQNLRGPRRDSPEVGTTMG